MNPAILKALSDLRAAGCDADADRIVVALSKQDALVPDDSALRLMADAVPYDLHSNIGAASSAERTHFLKLAFAVKQRPLRRDMTTNKEAAAVIVEMRARKVNHGKHTSPTLIEWADELESALSASAVTMPVSIAALLNHEQLSAFASACGYSNDEAFFTLELLDAAIAGAPQPASCNPTTQPASVPDGGLSKAIAEARARCHGVWPVEMTEMFCRGFRITRDQFDHENTPTTPEPRT